MNEFEYLHLPHFLSLGAGVQSSTIALMFAAGELEPMPKAAIFADTMAEPDDVYKWLDWLESQLPFPVHRVSKGDLRASALEKKVTADGRIITRTTVPVFTLSEDGSQGQVGHRSCTRDYKIRPITKLARKLGNIKRGEKEPQIVQIIGISLDEIRRIKPSREPWSVHRWPLIEKRITRHMCIEWMRKNDYPEPPRSACTFCPFHSASEWRRMKNNDPESFSDAVEFEKSLQAIKAESENFRSKPFLHPSCVPLDEIDFRNDIDRGQMLLWDDECEGMCGV